jgi:hypothetical protein
MNIIFFGLGVHPVHPPILQLDHHSCHSASITDYTHSLLQPRRWRQLVLLKHYSLPKDYMVSQLKDHSLDAHNAWSLSFNIDVTVCRLLLWT